MTEDKMDGWHHQLNGHEFEQAPGIGDGQGSLVRCSPWGHKELDMTEQLNRTELNIPLYMYVTLRPHGLYSPWNSLGQNAGVDSLSFFQGIVPTQGSNPGLLHWRLILYQLSHKGSPLQKVPIPNRIQTLVS